MVHERGGRRTRVKTAHILPALYAPIQAGLHQVEEVFREQLRSKYPFVDDLVKYGFRLGGKRLRPALILLSGLACAGIGPAHVLLAAAVEMIHTAPLILDDVLDEATIRRHLATVNVRWDNETRASSWAITFFTRAFAFPSSLDDVFACRELNEASPHHARRRTHRQIESRGDYSLSEDQYFEIIRDKGPPHADRKLLPRSGPTSPTPTPKIEGRVVPIWHASGRRFPDYRRPPWTCWATRIKVGKSLGTDLS